MRAIRGICIRTVYYLGREVPEVRHALNFTAYSEGWATYVENRSYLFEDNGLGNVMGELMRRDSSVTKDGLCAAGDQSQL